MKKLILSIFLVPAFSLPAQADSYEDRYPQQGSTIEIRIPDYEISRIEANFLDKPVLFYEVQKEPHDSTPISRAEFLELLFLNQEFPEIDITQAKSFPDVLPTNPHYNTIQKASALQIIDGYQNNNFGPYDTLTRGQIAKILVEAFDPEEILPKPLLFPDVPDTHIFYDHINRATQGKLFQGYPDGLMRPDRPINFLEAEIVIERLTQKEIQTLGPQTYHRAYLGIHRLSDLKIADLILNISRDDGSQDFQSIPIHIQNRDFPTHWFSLPPSKTELFGNDAQTQTWNMIYGAQANPKPEQLWEGKFQIPTNGELTLGFGDKLYINGSYSGSHFGHDWANDEGTPVYASNHGIVTLADWTPSYGNTIVIDHGQNVFTMYLHLSELKTTAGTEIKKGDLIGLMGSTGIATGPHLHFTHFIGDIIVDSDEWFYGEFY